MKRIRNGFYMIAAILALFLPIQAYAAGQDAVSLVQEGEWVAVVLEMSNAQQEKISAVAVSLQIDEESRDKVKAEFDFAGELDGAAQGFFYDESTGVLDIYAASGQSLFDGDNLNLGYVRVTLKGSGQILPVKISYLGASFQTANEIYGEKRPMVTNTPEPVNMQVGEDVSYAVPDSTSGSESGSTGGVTDGQQNHSGGGASGNGNVEQGLYDESTQLVNDPASAQKITSAVVRESDIHTELVDMSQGAAASIGGGSRPAGNSGKWIRPEGKVTVVSPENGPSSIWIAKGDDTSGKAEGNISDETGGSSSDGEEVPEGEEIRLDQKNGGAESDDDGKRNRVLLGAGIAAVSAVGIGLGVFAVLKTKGIFAFKKKKKKATKKRKKPVPKKKSASARKST